MSTMTQDFPRLRKLAVCPLCERAKDIGLLVCWPCYERYDFRNGLSAADQESLEAKELALPAAGDEIQGLYYGGRAALAALEATEIGNPRRHGEYQLREALHKFESALSPRALASILDGMPRVVPTAQLTAATPAPATSILEAIRALVIAAEESGWDNGDKAGVLERAREGLAALLGGAELEAIAHAESFISGFEGDETQEGIDALLARLRMLL